MQCAPEQSTVNLPDHLGHELGLPDQENMRRRLGCQFVGFLTDEIRDIKGSGASIETQLLLQLLFASLHDGTYQRPG